MTINYQNKDGSIISKYGNWESIDITTTDDTETTAWEKQLDLPSSTHIQAYIIGQTDDGDDHYIASIDYGAIKPTTGQDEERHWFGSAIDSDGSNIGICTNYYYTLDTGCYISNDSGFTFNQKYVDSKDSKRGYDKIACNSNGLYYIISQAILGGRLFISNNSGATWIETQPIGDLDDYWYGIDINSDGSKMVAAGGGSRLWLSTNSGSSWSEVRPAGDVDRTWSDVSINSDGSVIFASEWEGITPGYGRLWLSTNSGSSWSEVRPAGDVDGDWSCCTMDSDGSVLFVGEQNGRLWLSTNSGGSWSEARPAGDVNKIWFSIACSSDGSVLIAGEHNGRLWLSTNTGGSWSEVRPAGDMDRYWNTVSINSDGSKMIAGCYNITPLSFPGRIYLSTNSGVDWAEIRPATTQEFLSNQYLTYENSDETIFQKCEFGIYDNYVKLRIQGKAATTINWKMYIMSMNNEYALVGG